MNKEQRYCNSCKNHVETIITPLENGPHHAKETCSLCGRFVAFTQKPKNKDKRKPNKYKPEDLGLNYCQICLRPLNRLGSRGILEVHHVVEIGCGGKDIPENISVVCTCCHKWIHHQRTYLNIHLKDMYSVSELKKDMEKYGVPVSMRETMERVFLHQEARNA